MKNLMIKTRKNKILEKLTSFYLIKKKTFFKENYILKHWKSNWKKFQINQIICKNNNNKIHFLMILIHFSIIFNNYNRIFLKNKINFKIFKVN
jgi:hypothetical protein